MFRWLFRNARSSIDFFGLAGLDIMEVSVLCVIKKALKRKSS